MTIRWETVEVGGSPMRVYVGSPDTRGSHPGVVIAQHAAGVDYQMQDTVHRLAREGYIAAATELYHRQPKEAKDNQARIAMLRDDEVIADMNAALEFVRRQPGAGKLGVMGFCMGGRVAYLMACANSELKAAAMFYGGSLMKAWGNGPTTFERSAGIACPLLGFSGAEDTNPSPEDMRKLSAELTRLGKWHECHLYNDAGHAFCNFSAERFRPRASRAAWHETLAFFDEYLRA
jgi:carboxymethylenebutenolidase